MNIRTSIVGQSSASNVMPYFAKAKAILWVLLLAGFLAAPGLRPVAMSDNPADSTLVFSTPDQLAEDVKAAPCKNADREAAAESLLRKMGAPTDEITVEKFKNVEDIVVTKPGSDSDKIVVGAHYDKVNAGCGVIDNWTGVVTVAHLYRTLKDARLNKTVQFVLFGKEEQGLVGSEAMVKSFGKEQAESYCEMINIDSLGLGAPQVADNMSSSKLEKLAEQDAKILKTPFGHSTLAGADADSSSFIHRQIPAVTIQALNMEWPKILHSDRDDVGVLKPVSVYLGYRLALKMLLDLDSTPCDKYR